MARASRALEAMNMVANTPQHSAAPSQALNLRRTNGVIVAWALIGFIAYLVLPWYAIQDANGLSKIGEVFSDEQTGNGLMQALQFGRFWLWGGAVGLAIAGAAALVPAGKKQSTFLLVGGAVGLLALLCAGFAVGARGWSYEWMTNLWGELEVRQFGFGWGAFVALSSLLVQAVFLPSKTSFLA